MRRGRPLCHPLFHPVRDPLFHPLFNQDTDRTGPLIRSAQPQHPRPGGGRPLLASGARAGLLGVLAALAAAASAVPVPLLPGVAFGFGSVAALLAAVWLGVGPAMAVAAAGGLATLWSWDHGLALPLFVAEAGTVALLLRRLPLYGEPPPLALADGLFWLVAGLPLSLILFQGLLHQPLLPAVLAALTLATNGVLNAALAGALVILARWHSRRPASVSLREVLFSALLIAVLVPAFALTAVQGWAAHTGLAAGLESPAGPAASAALAALEQSLIEQFLLLALICLAAALGADALSRRIAAPILRLADLCSGPPGTLASATQPEPYPAPGTLRETERLAGAWRAMLDSRVEAERDAAARALRRHNADLQAFSDLMAAYRPPHEQIRALLEFACQVLAEDAAALGEIQVTHYRLLTSFGTSPGGPLPAPGVVLPLGPAEQATVADLEGTAENAADHRPPAGGGALPPGSGFASTAPPIRWTDAEGLNHLAVLSFGPGLGVFAASPEQLRVIALVGQAIASGLRERAVLDGLLASRQREIIGHLASGVAHDFNNLLGVLDINLDYLADLVGGTAGAGELGEVLDETRLAARHAKMVTAGLLSLSRGRRLATAPTPVSVVVERFVRTLARILPPHIEVQTQISPGLVALADEALLQSTLLNLCINARDAMGGRGTLEIGLARINCPRSRPLTLGRLEPGDYVELAVSDSGSGMSAEVLGHIFQPLFSTKSSGRGTGLGLFMVREFVAGCGGGVAVQTVPGSGSRFLVYLPVAAAGALPLPGPAAERPRPPPVPRARVLLVDDDPGMRAVLARTLEGHGLQVEQAVDGVEALALLDGGIACDLVLSDIVMPRMDGIELHRRLARAAPRLPVILMTADDHQSVQAAGLPVDTLILYKPLVTGILLSRISERLRRAD